MRPPAGRAAGQIGAIDVSAAAVSPAAGYWDISIQTGSYKGFTVRSHPCIVLCRTDTRDSSAGIVTFRYTDHNSVMSQNIERNAEWSNVRIVNVRGWRLVQDNLPFVPSSCLSFQPASPCNYNMAVFYLRPARTRSQRQ